MKWTDEQTNQCQIFNKTRTWLIILVGNWLNLLDYQQLCINYLFVLRHYTNPPFDIWKKNAHRVWRKRNCLKFHLRYIHNQSFARSFFYSRAFIQLINISKCLYVYTWMLKCNHRAVEQLEWKTYDEKVEEFENFSNE